MSVSQNLFHDRCPGACVRILQQGPQWELAPETPSGARGNCWYRFLAGVDASAETLQVQLRWPAAGKSQEADYSGNDNFSQVLDRCCFLDAGDGRWQRLEEVSLVDDGALIRLPPGSANRRLAVGMPVTAIDLHRILDQLRLSPWAELRHIGDARRGSPVWGLTIQEGEEAQGTIILQSLQHGSEWAGLRVLSSLILFLLSEAGQALRQRWRWCCYPATNADSLYQGWRGDAADVDGINHNRDWGTFSLPEVAAVAQDIQEQLKQGPPLLQVLDLHMGWNWRSDPGSAVGIALPEAAESTLAPVIQERHRSFADALIAQAGFTRNLWPIHSADRPTFPSWLYRETGVHGHTLEFSRHLWPNAEGEWVPPQQVFEENCGIRLAQVVDAFLLAEQEKERAP